MNTTQVSPQSQDESVNQQCIGTQCFRLDNFERKKKSSGRLEAAFSAAVSKMNICNDPLPFLFGVKNIFGLAERIYIKPALELFGCDVLTKQVVDLAESLQSKACQEVGVRGRNRQNLTESLESIGKECTYTITQETSVALLDCYPNFNISVPRQEINKTIKATKILCQEKIYSIPKGDKIKLCDDIEAALESHNILALNKVLGYVAPPRSDEKIMPTKDSLLILELRFKQLSLGKQIIEKAACTDLSREEKTLSAHLLEIGNTVRNSYCFDSRSFAIERGFKVNLRPDLSFLYVLECRSLIEKLHQEDREQLCQDPEAIIFPPATGVNSFFNKGISNIKKICNGFQSERGKAIEVTLQTIKTFNQANGITNIPYTSIGQGVNHRQSDVLFYDGEVVPPLLSELSQGNYNIPETLGAKAEGVLPSAVSVSKATGIAATTFFLGLGAGLVIAKGGLGFWKRVKESCHKDTQVPTYQAVRVSADEASLQPSLAITTRRIV